MPHPTPPPPPPQLFHFAVWGLPLILAGVTLARGAYGPTPGMGCWYGAHVSTQYRFYGVVVASLLCNVVVYAVIFRRLRALLTEKGAQPRYKRNQKLMAQRLLWYPVRFDVCPVCL